MQLGEPVVLSDQLVGSVVLVRDRGAPSGDRGYVPVVVVRVRVRCVATVLVQQCLETVSMQTRLSRDLSP